MRAIQRNGLYAVLGVLAAMLLLAIPASGVRAAGADICDPTNLITGVKVGVDANADPDNDGFNNQQECQGLSTGASGNAYITFTGWNSKADAVDRKTYLDPSALDLFVIIVPNGTNRFDKIKNSTTPAKDGNLTEMVNPQNIGITTHEISATTSADARTVSTINISGTKQKAMRVTESRDTNMGTTKNPTPFGSANWGTPSGLDDATAYTYRIEKHVNDTCSTKECKDGISGITVTRGSTDFSPVINQYVKSVVAHEMGHMMKLTTAADAAFNGNHYDPASKVIMSQNITWVKNGNTQVIYYIPNGNAPNGYVTPTDVDNKGLSGL